MFSIFKSCEHEYVHEGRNVYCRKCAKSFQMECTHLWSEIQKSTTYRSDDHPDYDDLPLGTKFTLQCKSCGEIKHYKNY